METTEKKDGKALESKPKQKKLTAREIHEDLIDLAVYAERKNGEFVSEEEAMEFLRSHGKL
ncbi:hypothetical protein [Dyadobacter jiangsuensis]|uniref:Uncharacterized protein n=1 Tax=Dyadobacter jiangsuensis TaxID=1591085 RepID=A0A2P8FN84_9BACT|nr:hypothetical protein [Dyadobacter jiangsuensis]PSL23179.1 hypothetical protein CLV60_11756 [Dyadobacter jiangsuensis]